VAAAKKRVALVGESERGRPTTVNKKLTTTRQEGDAWPGYNEEKKTKASEVYPNREKKTTKSSIPIEGGGGGGWGGGRLGSKRLFRRRAGQEGWVKKKKSFSGKMGRWGAGKCQTF